MNQTKITIYDTTQSIYKQTFLTTSHKWYNMTIFSVANKPGPSYNKIHTHTGNPSAAVSQLILFLSDTMKDVPLETHSSFLN